MAPATTPRSEHPPRTPRGVAKRWLELQGLDETERAEAIEELRAQASGSKPYLVALEAIASLAPPFAVDVADGFRDAGLDESEAIETLVRLCEDETFQQTWTDWEDVQDRTEIRLRLQALANVDRLHPQLAPFVTFFFRASDPDLYRWGALAVGRHLDEVAELRDYVERWTQAREIDPREPAILDGTRSPRRLLIAQAGAATRPEPNAAEFLGDPTVALERLTSRPLGEVSPLDLRAALRAGATLADTREAPPPPVRDLLVSTAGTPQYAVDRGLVEAWAELFATVRPSHDDRALAEAWSDLATQQTEALREADEVGPQVEAMQALDRLVQILTHLDPSFGQTLGDRLQETSAPLEWVWLSTRLQAWRHRGQGRDAEPIDRIELEPLPSEGLPSPMRTILGHAWPSARPHEDSSLVDARREAALDLLDELLALLSSEQDWKSASTRTRSMVCFTILDLLRHETLPRERVEAHLDRHGIPSGGGSPSTGGRTEQRWALARILARVIDFEVESGDRIVDARTLHEIDDDLLLMGLVPTQRETPWLPALADAIEHRFRWRIRQDPDFQPVAFLVRVSVREPHPQLYEALAQTSQGRRYPRHGDGEEFELTEIARSMAKQARAVNRDAPVQTQLDAWDPAHLADQDATAEAIAMLRAELTALEPGADPSHTAQRLAALVGRWNPRTPTEPTTLVGLLAMLHGDDRPMTRPGDPPWTSRSSGELLEQVSQEATRIATLEERLDARDPLAETQVEIEELRTAWSRIVDLVSDGLPPAETRLIRARSQGLLEELDRGARALGDLAEAFTQTAGGGAERWEPLLETANREFEGQARQSVAGQLWRALWDPPPEVRPPAGESWDRRRRLVRWGLTTDVPQEWSTSEQEAWEARVCAAFADLLATAMEANRVDRVGPLLRNPVYEPARVRQGARDTMEKARAWCRDRYRPTASLHAARAIARADGRPPPGLARELSGFLLHFSPIWSALLVGAIFLLDFGDAWVQLAQARDVTGIALTCGIGVLGAYLYVVRDLQSKVSTAADAGPGWLSLTTRSAAFTATCVAVAAAITSFLWWMLRSTEAVVRGPWAVGNVAVWTGFALFVGIVFGLVIQKGL